MICRLFSKQILTMHHRKAIRDMIPIIDPEDDYLTIAAAEEQMAMTQDGRQKELQEAHVKLKREFSLYVYA